MGIDRRIFREFYTKSKSQMGATIYNIVYLAHNRVLLRSNIFLIQMYRSLRDRASWRDYVSHTVLELLLMAVGWAAAHLYSVPNASLMHLSKNNSYKGCCLLGWW